MTIAVDLGRKSPTQTNKIGRLSIYLSIHSAAPSFRVLRAVALSVQELKERL